MIVQGFKGYTVLNFNQNNYKKYSGFATGKIDYTSYGLWSRNCLIQNVSIDLNECDLLLALLKQLPSLNCRSLSVVYLGNSFHINNIIQALESSRIYYEFIVANPKNVDIHKLRFTSNCGIFVLCNCKKNEVFKINNQTSYLVKSKFNVETLLSHSLHSEKTMRVNVPFFTESLNHNVYFNRKVFIDINGNIKNTRMSNVYFGNIQSDSISAKIKNKKFSEVWYTSKKYTDVCKDCEFRMMCNDSRVPIIRGNKNFYHDTECNYNPYIQKWKGEKGYESLNS